MRLSDGSTEKILGDISSHYYQTTVHLQPYSPGKRFHAVINSDSELIITKTSTESMIAYSLNAARQALFYPDGQYMLVTFDNGDIWFVESSFWDSSSLDYIDRRSYSKYLDNNKILRPLYVIKNTLGPPQDIFLSKDGSLMAMILDDKSIISIWKVSDFAEIGRIKNQRWPTSLSFGPDNGILAVVTADNIIRLWDISSAQLLAELRGHDRTVKAVAFSSDGRFFASMDDKWVNIWGIMPYNDFHSASQTATAIANIPPTATRSQAYVPTPTPVPTNSIPSYESLLPLPWPVEIPSAEQISETKSCPLEELLNTRYPVLLFYDQLETAYNVKSACDWAVLAYACATHSDYQAEINYEGRRAFVQAIVRNPAFAFSELIYLGLTQLNRE